MVFCCSICQERLESPGAEGDGRIAVVKCGHVFHFSCIRTWWMSVYQNMNYAGLPNDLEIPCPVCRTPSRTQVFQVDLTIRDDNLYPTEQEANEITILQQNIDEMATKIDKMTNEKNLKDLEIFNLEKTIAELEAELAALDEKPDESQIEDQFEDVNISPENFFGTNVTLNLPEPTAGPSGSIMPREDEASVSVNECKENLALISKNRKSDKKEKLTTKLRTIGKNARPARRGSINYNLRSGKNCSMM